MFAILPLLPHPSSYTLVPTTSASPTSPPSNLPQDPPSRSTYQNLVTESFRLSTRLCSTIHPDSFQELIPRCAPSSLPCSSPHSFLSVKSSVHLLPRARRHRSTTGCKRFGWPRACRRVRLCMLPRRSGRWRGVRTAWLPTTRLATMPSRSVVWRRRRRRRRCPVRSGRAGRCVRTRWRTSGRRRAVSLIALLVLRSGLPSSGARRSLLVRWVPSPLRVGTARSDVDVIRLDPTFDEAGPPSTSTSRRTQEPTLDPRGTALHRGRL